MVVNVITSADFFWCDYYFYIVVLVFLFIIFNKPYFNQSLSDCRLSHICLIDIFLKPIFPHSLKNLEKFC